MKLLISIVCLAAIPGISIAQQKPQYTQYILNQYIINPALSGIENYIDINASQRTQWDGIAGAPSTTYITIQGPINKQDYRTTATSYPVADADNPIGKEYWDEYTVAPAHHGVGLQIIKDKAGPLSNLSAYGTYAYHVGLTRKLNIAAGIGAGISRYDLDVAALDFMNTEVDPSVYNNYAVNKNKFDMTAGVYLYSDKYFVGLSAQQIVPSRLVFADNTITTLDGTTVPHTFLTGGYRFMLSEDINMTPSLMFKYIQSMPIQAELNVKLQYRDLLWAGLSYRHKDGAAAMAGIHLFSCVNVSYSYDYSTSALRTYNYGTHEIIIGFQIGNKYDRLKRYSCPRLRIW